MSNDHTPKAIDLESAKRFLQDPDSYDLSEATSITDEAAEVLSKDRRGQLSLDGLTELSDTAAKSLSKHQGSLSLGGLTELSDAAEGSVNSFFTDSAL